MDHRPRRGAPGGRPAPDARGRARRGHTGLRGAGLAFLTKRVGHAVLVGRVLASVALTGLPGTARAQLAHPGVGDLGLGDQVTVLARGAAALAANPAALGLPGGPSALVLPTRLTAGLGPVSLGDLADWSGEVVPDAVREAWLSRIRTEGREVGAAAAGFTPFAFVSNGVGIQLSTVAVVDARLNPDAAELLLFGNAGRSGDPRDFELGDSRLEGAVVSTLAVGRALDAGRVAGGRLRLGGALTWSVGHGVLTARDAGSALVSEPFEAGLRFPLVTPREGAGAAVGTGLGVDVGALWMGEDVHLGASVRNALHGFRWRLDRLAFRPGTALFDDETSESDFDERPLEQAPPDLVDDARDLDFPAVVTVGAAVFPGGAAVTAELRHRLTAGIDPEPRTRLGLAGEASPLPWLPVRAHAAWVTGGYQLGGGAGIRIGPVEVGGAGAYRDADGRETVVWSLGVGIGAGR